MDTIIYRRIHDSRINCDEFAEMRPSAQCNVRTVHVCSLPRPTIVENPIQLHARTTRFDSRELGFKRKPLYDGHFSGDHNRMCSNGVNHHFLAAATTPEAEGLTPKAWTSTSCCLPGKTSAWS